MKKAVSRLTKLGLSDYEARTYIALLRENPLTAYEISKVSGIPSSKIYEVIKKLESKQIIQSIRGERSRMFVPTSPSEFIESFRASVEDSLSAVRTELKGFRVSKTANYTWHIHDYEGLILKAKRILDTSHKMVLLSLWPSELEVLEQTIGNTERRGVKISIIHYGATKKRFGQLFRHPVEDTRFSHDRVRGFILIADSKEALIGRVEEKETDAIWSTNEGFVMMAEDYVRHDIYVMKIISRFDPLLKDKFGARYEKLLDVYSDEEVKKNGA
jgi:sugar-specific transcriptional regulator TrmB